MTRPATFALLAALLCFSPAAASEVAPCAPTLAGGEPTIQLAQQDVSTVATIVGNTIRPRAGYAFRQMTVGNRAVTVIAATNSMEVPGTVTCKCDGDSAGSCTLVVTPGLGYCSSIDCACQIGLSAMPLPPGAP